MMVPYKLRVIAGVITDVLRDIAVGHPFGDDGECPILEGVRDSDEIEDVWMGQVLPHGDFSTKVLCDV